MRPSFVTEPTTITTECWDCRREFAGPCPDGKGGPPPLPRGISHLDGESRAFCWQCARVRQARYDDCFIALFGEANEEEGRYV